MPQPAEHDYLAILILRFWWHSSLISIQLILLLSKASQIFRSLHYWLHISTLTSEPNRYFGLNFLSSRFANLIILEITPLWPHSVRLIYISVWIDISPILSYTKCKNASFKFGPDATKLSHVLLLFCKQWRSFSPSQCPCLRLQISYF